MLDAIHTAYPTGVVTIIEKTTRRVLSSAWSASNHTGPAAVVNTERPAVGDPATRPGGKDCPLRREMRVCCEINQRRTAEFDYLIVTVLTWL